MTGEEFLAQKVSPKLCNCGCGNPLQPRFDGVRQTIDGKEVNDDCYYDKISDIIEKHPIRKPR